MHAEEVKRTRKPKPTRNPDAGEVVCPFDGRTAPVRKNANGKLYYNCPGCGIVQPALAPFQDWVLDHATLYGPEGKPQREAEPAAPAVVVTVTPPPANETDTARAVRVAAEARRGFRGIFKK